MMESLPTEQQQTLSADQTAIRPGMELEGVEPVRVLEAYHRYLYASRFTKNRRVLDVACRTGYGAALVSINAESVIAINPDEQLVNKASQTYGEFQNLRFEAGKYDDLHLRDSSIDIAICFDIVGSLPADTRPKLMESIRRALVPGGLALVSVPIRSADAVTEDGTSGGDLPAFSGVELFEFLKLQFQHVRFIGQKPLTLSAMWSLHEWQDDLFRFHMRDDLFTLPRSVEMFSEPERIVALCSEEPISAEIANNSKSFYFDIAQTARARKLVKEMEDLEKQVSQARTFGMQVSEERDTFRSAIAVLTNENLGYINKLEESQRELDEQVARAIALEQEVATRNAAYEDLRRAHDEQTVWAEKLGQDHGVLLDRVQELERRLEEVSLHAAASGEENVGLRERTQLLHRQVEELSAQLAAAEELRPKLEEAESRCQRMLDSSSETNARTEFLSAQVNELQAALEEKIRASVEMESRLSASQERVAELEQMVTGSAEAARVREEELEQLRARVGEIETHHAAETTQSAAAIQESQKLRARLYELQKQFDDRAAAARNSGQENEKLNARVAAMQKSMEEKSAAVVLLNQEIAGLKEKIQHAEHEYENKLKQAHQWEENNRKRLENLNELQRKCEEQALVIRQMKNEADKQTIAFDTFQKSQSDLQQRYNRSQIKVQELQQELAILEQRVQQITGSGVMKALSRFGLLPREGK